MIVSLFLASFPILFCGGYPEDDNNRANDARNPHNQVGYGVVYEEENGAEDHCAHQQHNPHLCPLAHTTTTLVVADVDA